jgi:hypothetical protein
MSTDNPETRSELSVTALPALLSELGVSRVFAVEELGRLCAASAAHIPQHISGRSSGRETSGGEFRNVVRAVA